MINNLKYWSWMGAFTVSVMFWGQLVWMMAH
ncbi:MULTISPECIES: small membrane protein YmiC [unclassified Enterobacter]|nr:MULTISPECIES: small membrane protein YmiC [unclassified Enterobacter]WJD48661.1 small membrane protein YmiC [Enterobacter sp. PGRG2]